MFDVSEVVRDTNKEWYLWSGYVNLEWSYLEDFYKKFDEYKALILLRIHALP